MGADHGGLRRVGAVVAAAGASRRMRQCKALLPWHCQPAVMAVVQRLMQIYATPIACVVGPQRDRIEAALAHLPVRIVHNPAPATGGLLGSYQVGIRTLLAEPVEGAVLALVDQPHLPLSVYQTLLQRARAKPQCVIRPRYLGRCGHPFYVPITLWDNLLRWPAQQTMRDFLRANSAELDEIDVDTDAILHDVDTPQDYARLLARFT